MCELAHYPDHWQEDLWVQPVPLQRSLLTRADMTSERWKNGGGRGETRQRRGVMDKGDTEGSFIMDDSH